MWFQSVVKGREPSVRKAGLKPQPKWACRPSSEHKPEPQPYPKDPEDYFIPHPEGISCPRCMCRLYCLGWHETKYSSCWSCKRVMELEWI